MSDTPRTDAFVKSMGDPLDMAKQLERELAECKLRLEEARDEVVSWKRTAMLWREAASNGRTIVVRNTGP